MSSTGTEYGFESQTEESDHSTGHLSELGPVQICQHLVRKDDEVEIGQVDNVKSALETLGRSTRDCDLEDDDAHNTRLARAARTIHDFLQVANKTISTEEQYNGLTVWMKAELVNCLDGILSERFLRALFLLRQQIRNLSIRREHVATPRTATLPDVVIAAIIDYVSCNSTLNEQMELETSSSCQTIELAVRLPTRFESLVDFMVTPITIRDRDKDLKAKLGALALLYCAHCLNPVSNQASLKNLANSLSTLALSCPSDKLSHSAMAHMLCLYIFSHSASKDDLHPFRPATNSTIWKLLLEIFPNPSISLKEGVNLTQKMIFSHGALVIPWVWSNNSLCTGQEEEWVEAITLLWIRHEYLVHYPNFMEIQSSSSHQSLRSSRSSLESLSPPGVMEALLRNQALGLKGMINGKSQQSFAVKKPFSRYITAVFLQAYCDLCDSPNFTLDVAEKTNLLAAIQNYILTSIDQSFRESGASDLEVLDLILKMPPEPCVQIMQTLQINVHRMLDNSLLEIEMSADPIQQKDENRYHQVRASRTLNFFMKWVEIHPFDERLVKPLTSLVNLINTLLTPLSFEHNIALSVTQLVSNIAKSAKGKWTLNHRQLEIVSNALIEIMMTGDDQARNDASLNSANFVKENCIQFDYEMNYPLHFFHALREQLANLLWIHSITMPQKDSSSHSEGERWSFSEQLMHKSLGMLIAEAMYAMYEKFNDLNS